MSLVSTTFAAQERLTTSKYDVIKVTLDDTHKIVVNAVPNGQAPKSVKTLMEEVGGVSAINGAFFNAYAKNPADQDSDMIAIRNGRKRAVYGDDLGETRALFGFQKDGTPLMATNATRSRENGGWYNSEFSKIENGLAMHVLLVDGRNVSYNNAEMNGDGKQGKVAMKEFICSTADKKTVYFGKVNAVTFVGLAEYIQSEFGCNDAIQLDAGGSTAIYFEGEKIAGPGRNVKDAFVVIEDNSKYQAELEEAIQWMYDHGMTRYNEPDSFMAKNSINREQASKFFGVLAENIFDKDEEVNSDATCTFSDIATADQTLTENIVQSCKIGLFNGYSGKFDPKAKLTNAQALAVLTRIVYQKLDESNNPWYQNYYSKENLTDWISADGLNVSKWSKVDGEANRGELAVMFYRTAKLLEAENGVSSSSKTKKKEEKSESDEKNE